MRMKYMYYLMKENYGALKNLQMVNDPYKIGNSSTNRGRIDNWKAAREALTSVSVIPYFKDTCMEILDNPFFAQTNDTFYVPYETYQQLNVKYTNLLIQMKSIIDFYESAGFDTTEIGFDVKMPATDDFEEFSKDIDQLCKSINQCPYLKVENEKISLKKTDIGSIWFEFMIAATGTSLIAFNLAKLIDKCIKIKSHYITVKQQEESLRHLTLENDVLENLKKTQEQITKALIDNCVEELQQDLPEIKLDNEAKERVKFSITNISKLMEKGMEIYASIDSPQEVKELFPTSDEMIFLPKPQKLLKGDMEE